MLTTNVSKIKKSAPANITFILNALSENGIIFVCMGLFSKSKSNVTLTKMYFFKWGCIRMRKLYELCSICSSKDIVRPIFHAELFNVK